MSRCHHLHVTKSWADFQCLHFSKFLISSRLYCASRCLALYTRWGPEKGTCEPTINSSIIDMSTSNWRELAVLQRHRSLRVNRDIKCGDKHTGRPLEHLSRILWIRLKNSVLHNASLCFIIGRLVKDLGVVLERGKECEWVTGREHSNGWVEHRELGRCK